MKILRPPRIRSLPGEGERSASWLELFFDLVFVVAVAQLALALADDPSAGGFARFALLFVPVWWAWVGYTNFSDRFGADDAGSRTLMLLGMLAVAGLAVAVPEAFAGASAAFALCYVANRLVLIAMNLRVWRHIPEAAPNVRALAGGFSVGTAIWLASLFVPEPGRYLLWLAAILIEGAVPWIFQRAVMTVPTHPSHLPERYGLFTIIVLGESLVAVVIGLDHAEWNLAVGWVAAAGFATAAAMWWIYFDALDSPRLKPTQLARNTFIYAHLAIAMGLTLAGVGVKKAILSGEQIPAAGVWALCGGVALTLVAISLISIVCMEGRRDLTLPARLATAGAVVLIGAVGSELAPPLLMALLLAALASLVGFELVERESRAAETRTR